MDATTSISRNSLALPNSQDAAAAKSNPQEEALQSLTKQILKSRIFRGFYKERLYVDTLSSYRDIIILHRSERELEKVLLDIKQKLLLFYQHVPNIWVAVTTGPLPGVPNLSDVALNTQIWAELDDMAFGEYWFSIKTVRFRGKEIALRIKMLRKVETETIPLPRRRLRSELSEKRSLTPVDMQSYSDATDVGEKDEVSEKSATTMIDTPHIGLQDFVEVVQQWGNSFKLSIYDFMSKDINKNNLKGVLQFIGLLFVSLFTFAVEAVKFLGIFTLRFMFELSRLAHILSPLAIKLIDVLNKIVGGFYILLAMIWRDTVGKGQPQRAPNLPAVEYNRPLYKSIEYNVRQNMRQDKRWNSDYERRCQ